MIMDGILSMGGYNVKSLLANVELEKLLNWFAFKDGSCRAFESLNKNIVLGSELRPLKNWYSFLGLMGKEMTNLRCTNSKS